MADKEKKITITLRVVGEDEKKKRISLSPSDGVIEVVERSKKLFLLTGDVCLKARIGTVEYVIESHSKEDSGVLQDAEEFIIYEKENKLVCIDGELFDLEKLQVQLSSSKLVRRQRHLAIPSMVTEFNEVKDFLYTAYYSTRNFIEIHMKVEQVGYSLAKLGLSSLGSMENFDFNCGLILEKLQGAIGYLFGGQNKMAMLNFKAVNNLLKTMINKSSKLQEMFEEGIEKVRDALSSTQTERAEQEKKLEIEEEKKTQTTQEGDNRQDEIKRAGEQVKVIDQEANETKHKVSAEEVGLLMREKDVMRRRILEKSKALGKSKKQLERQDKSIRRLVETCESLHKAISSLKGLSNTMLKAEQIFGVLSNAIGSFASRTDALNEKVQDLASAKHGESLQNLWQSQPFKIEFVTCFSKCVALGDTFSSLLGQMKEATEGIHTFLCENPTQEEADRKIGKIWEMSEQKIQLTRGQEDDPQEECSDSDSVQQADSEDNREGLPSSTWPEGALDDTERTHPDVGLEESIPATDLLPAAPEVRPTTEDCRAAPCVKPMTYSSAVKQGTQSVPGETGIRDIQQGGGGAMINTTRVRRDDKGDSRGVGFGKRQQKMTNDVFKPCEGANLFINNLDINIDEECLKKEFDQFGIIINATVWQDKEGVSQGFGFVCYRSPAEAVKAINHMNGKIIGNKPVSVDLALKKEGRNVYVNNLAENIDHRYLYEKFKPFGIITSAKVIRDEYGNSQGYGFVCFSTSDDAAGAIERMNGQIVENRQLYVDLHVPRRKEGRNIYINNLAENIDDEHLYQEFEAFGKITSAKVMVDSYDGTSKSKGFGFVSYSTPQEAHSAIEEMNGKTIQDKKLYVDVAQSRAGKNVYVNNLARYIDDEQLYEAFDRFGTITSAKVKTDWEGNSIGFGFVCYSSPKEAAAAIEEMNGSKLENLHLYVALAQPPQRREYLK